MLRTTRVAPAKINSQTYRVSIISSYTYFLVTHSQIFSKPFPEQLNVSAAGI
jgi:hypothetical protein